VVLIIRGGDSGSLSTLMPSVVHLAEQVIRWSIVFIFLIEPKYGGQSISGEVKLEGSPVRVTNTKARIFFKTSLEPRDILVINRVVA
jgi:hypothetical protein